MENEMYKETIPPGRAAAFIRSPYSACFYPVGLSDLSSVAWIVFSQG